MADYDAELTSLDEGIRRLKIEYDIYFSNHRRKPPDDLRLRMENTAKRLSEATEMSVSQRFRYNTLIARFCVYRDLWRRTQQERESANENPRASSGPMPKSDGHTSSQSPGVQVSIGDPDAESGKIQCLYDELLRIRGENAKESPGISYQQFTNYIASQTQGIKTRYRCSSVVFRIAVEANAVKFTARADT